MKCRQCNAEAVPEAVFCHQCGRPVGDLAGDLNAKQRFAAALSQGGADDDDPEEVLWQGRYSPRAMLGSWAAAGVLTLAVLIGGAVVGMSGTAWSIAIGLVLLGWLALVGLLFYRQLSIHYFLTTQRLLHEHGLLWREMDRIEAIDIDDVSYMQGPVQRMFGIGRIRITSSDATTPEFDILGIDDVRNVAAMIDEVRRQERRRRGIHIESV